MSLSELMIDIPAEHEANVFGQFDTYAKKLERTFHVTLIARDGSTKIVGETNAAEKARRVMMQLLELSKRGNTITEQNVDYAISLVFEDQEEGIVEIDRELICHTLQGKPIKPKTLGQKKYVDAIRKDMITFGLGPAGTGKTYLAMAMAITAFKRNEVGRIILTRPAIEAGEKLGFLPGDLQSKIDPYLRPLYDALYEIMGADSFIKNSEKGLIEVAPLAYMRGRTLDNAFIILDEAQNTTPAQMKMFLTRIGFGSKVVITGDSTQKDLPSGTTSGLDVAVKVVKDLEGISICTLTSKDVVRHPLVQKIVKAYEEYEKKSNAKTRGNVRRKKQCKMIKKFGFIPTLNPLSTNQGCTMSTCVKRELLAMMNCSFGYGEGLVVLATSLCLQCSRYIATRFLLAKQKLPKVRSSCTALLNVPLGNVRKRISSFYTTWWNCL